MKETDKFLIELRNLLRQYNAEIGFVCSEYSDLHGVTGEKMVVDIGNQRRDISVGYWISAEDVDCK